MQPRNFIRRLRLVWLLAGCGLVAVPTGASAAPPANDAFTNAQVISGLPFTATGTNVDATKETGEPNHAGGEGGHSVWYRLTVPVSGTVTAETCDEDNYLSLSTLLAVYTGTSVNDLTEVGSNNNAPLPNSCPNPFQSHLSFFATAGTTYHIAVDGEYGLTGSITLDIYAGLPQCSDGVDNDGDGRVDFGAVPPPGVPFTADPGCSDPLDNDETEPPQCRDGVDNDGDGQVDYPDDPDCDGPDDDDETEISNPESGLPPILLDVGRAHLWITAKWHLYGGTETYRLVIGQDPTEDPYLGLAGTGWFYDTSFGTLTATQTSFVADVQAQPGRYYVRVASCPAGSGLLCQSLAKWSAVRSVDIPLELDCEDGADNDGDGRIDHPADPGCTQAKDFSENDPLAPVTPSGPTRAAVSARGLDGVGFVRSRGVAVGVACPQACRITSTLQLGGRTAGQRSVRLSASGHTRFAVKLNTRARGGLKGARSATLKLTTRVANAKGTRLRTDTRTIRLSGRTPSNRAPIVPVPTSFKRTYRLQYNALGRLAGAYDTIIASRPARDPDGDPLTYSWKATTDVVRGKGLSAVWTRSAALGVLEKGTLRLTVSDGRGKTVVRVFG